MTLKEVEENLIKIGAHLPMDRPEYAATTVAAVTMNMLMVLPDTMTVGMFRQAVEQAASVHPVDALHRIATEGGI